jgi:hypothetical protein
MKSQELILSSIQLKPMINIKNLDTELWCPILKFGKKKSGEYKFPIVFKNYKKAEKIYDELEKLKGKTIDEVREKSDAIYEKYKQFDYKNK